MGPDVLALFIPILAVGGLFAWLISISPVGKAFAERLRHGAVPPVPGGSEREELVAAVDDLRREVAELAERVDFTERLLARKSSAESSAPPDRVAG